MISLTWQQVNAWRLSQHFLLQRLPRQDFLHAVRQTGGIQAQVMSAAEMAIGARVDGFTSQDVQSALWVDRSLLKTWAMRATLHLIPTSDFPLYIAARSLTENRNWDYYFSYFGVNDVVLEEYLTIGPEILTDRPMTRQQFAAATSERIKSPELYELLISKGWGTPLKPLAWRGELCFGPNQGQNVTFVRPSAWIGKWHSIQPDMALQEVIRRYLRTYGPARVENFVLWWGSNLSPVRKVFRSISNEVETVDVEGWQAIALRTTLDAMMNTELIGAVNLLPLFDAYTMGLGRGQEVEPLLAREYQQQVYRPQGWISAVVLVDGYIKGIWDYKNQRKDMRIIITLFSPLTERAKQGIAAEVDRMGKFLNKNISLEFKER